MGNQLAQPARLQPEVLADLQGVVYKETLGMVVRILLSRTRCRLHSLQPQASNAHWHFALGGGRFLKTLLCVHDDGGLVVVKVGR